MTSPMLRLGTVAALAIVTAAITVSGAALPAREPRPLPPVEPDGRTVTVCPPASSVTIASATTWGTLGVRSLEADQVQTVPTGRGLTLTELTAAQLVIAEGRQNQNSAVSAYAKHPEGEDRGLSLARCGTPTTSAWFTGLPSTPEGELNARSVVVLVNPDAGQAEVDLRLFGPSGLQVAPGARGIAVPARSVRTVALDTLFTRAEPVGLEVRATKGRIAPTVRQYAGVGVQPVGSDWQVAARPPARTQIVPGVPGGPGARTLVLTNPGNRRTTATIDVLGPTGTFTPVDAGSLDVNAESTAEVDLSRGLGGDPGAVRITSEQPVVATVVSRNGDPGPDADIAVQASAEPITGTALAAIAAAPGARGYVLVSNNGEADVTLPLRLIGTDGAQLAATELSITAGATAVWEVGEVNQPAGVQARVPAGTNLYAGIELRSAADPAGGLATTPLSTAQQAERVIGAEPEHDPKVAR